jgi:hypothetical protein
MQQDVFLFPNNIEWKLPHDFSIDLSAFAERKSYVSSYNRFLSSSYELGFIFGTFLGDGTARYFKYRQTTIGFVEWAFSSGEHATAEKLATAIELAIGKTPRIYQPRDNIRCVRLYSMQWARLFTEFGKRAEKALPTKYLVSNPRYLQGLLDGLIDSDGSRPQHGRISFTNTSHHLIELFGLLCHYVYGSLPNLEAHGPAGLGTIKGRQSRLKASYRARLNRTHAKRRTEN